jgi:DNA-binding MarR family transcriptional regulator
VLGSIVARGPLGLSELATQQAINRTMLSRVLGKLEAADLIVRRSSIADGRAIEVVATRKGAGLRERLIARQAGDAAGTSTGRAWSPRSTR